MLDYQNYPCPHCKEPALIYMQSIGDAHCEACGEWETPEEEIE